MDTEGGQSCLVLFVNGKKVLVENANPRSTLLWYIREELCLTGSKLSCGQGGCGACTVMISEVDRKSSKLSHYTVNACIYPLVCTHGKSVTTVEGIGSTRTVLHPVQERLAVCHGTQCGFCSPGMVMSMYTLLRNTPKPTGLQIEDAIQGNLCRCTGYRTILDSFKTFVIDDDCPLEENCCKNKSNKETSKPDKLLYDVTTFKPLNESQEIIFPNELQMNHTYDQDDLTFKNGDLFWFRPATLELATEKMKSVPNCEWAMGHLHKKGKLNRNTISIGHLPELNGLYLKPDYIEFGSGTKLSDLQNFMRHLILKHNIPGYSDLLENVDKERYKLTAECILSTFTNWFSGNQIKNVGTIGGNLLIGSNTSNFIPMFMILKAEAIFIDGSEENTIEIKSNFIEKTRAMSPTYLLKKIRIPNVQDDFIGYYYAAGQTHVGGRSSIIKAVYKANITSCGHMSKLTVAYGGIRDSSIMYEDIIGNCDFDENIISQYAKWFKQTLKGKEESYEEVVAVNLFSAFYHDMQIALSQGLNSGFVSQNKRLVTVSGIHVWEPQSDRKSVGQPIPTQWALEHVTGEAKYVMDMPKFKEELYMSLVTSSKAHAYIISTDATRAFQIEGVVDYVDYTDIPGTNFLSNDEEIFVSREVTHIGQTIGGIVATTPEAAADGIKAVVVTYDDLPAIFTIKEAIEKESYLLPSDVSEHGNVEEAFCQSMHILEGEIETGGQEHYYMETQSTIVVPKQEYQQYDIYTTTQIPELAQSSIAKALGLPFHKINVHSRRIGGGFGGKETRNLLTSVPASIAAYKHNKPVRISLDRAVDMTVTGGKHPSYTRYKVGFNEEGRIQALYSDLYLNGGDSRGYTYEVLCCAYLRGDSACKIPNYKRTCYGCKTNLAPNTAFRGFGSQQGSIAIHVCVDRIAKYLHMDRVKVYEINFYKDGDLNITNQVMVNCNMWKCWELVKSTAAYDVRKRQVMEYNSQHRYKKKAIALAPVMYQLTFGEIKVLNQGAALVNIYTDGSVLVHHGGIEMGQGLNIKLIQIASETFGIHHSRVIIDEVNTNTIPNTVPTAGSAATDLYGGAVKNACDKLNERLQSLKDRKPRATWEELISCAFLERIHLSATGYYKPVGIWYDKAKSEGDAARYFSFDAACSEIELDVLTGEHKLLQTDIVFDVGKSINPAIDIGQIEGAFLQGYGSYCLEELLYSPKGELLTTGPSSYRVPTVRDIPHKLNVTLLKDHPNEKAVYSSKAIGEPPLLLGISVYLAIKDAVTSVRIDNGLLEDFQLNSPTTPKRVLSVCAN